MSVQPVDANMKHFRNLRTLLGIGLTWSVLWVAVAIVVGTIVGVVDPEEIDPGEEPISLAPMIGLVSFLCGVAFGALVSTAERRTPIVDLPLIRVAMWGILVSAALPLVTGRGIPEMLVIVPLGAVSAVTSVAIVRRWAALPVTR